MTDPDTPPASAPAGTGRGAAEPAATGDVCEAFPAGSTVELFPVNFTAYRHHPDLETEAHVRVIADLLAPYGLHVNRWKVPEDERDRQAVEDRLGAWRRPTAENGNTVLYWVGHGSAQHLAHHRTPAPIDDGVSPADVARAIGSRLLHPDAEDSWVIVVLDACFSRRFAQQVHRTLLGEYADAERYLLLSTAAKGYTELGAFTRALDRALTVTFRGRSAIGLAELGSKLFEELGGYRADTADDRRDRLVRMLPDVASAVSAPLDQLAELQAVIDQLPTDEQRHFLPKASGAELGELAWYFHGRTLERDDILRWLVTATHGALVVTGPAGAGKSALLGHILLHTNTQLRDILIRHGHLHPLPAGTPCPDDPFDLVAHLSGLSFTRILQLVAQAAGLPDLAQQAADGQPSADLAARLITQLRTRQAPLTLLFDALDEAEQPLTIADTLLRPLAALPTVRVVIGTRRSTREGPDQPVLADTNILDTLQPRPGTDGGGLQWVEVTQDREALAGYLRAKLHAARHRNTLDADDDLIATAVHRLVTGHQQDGAEPQQFLYARLAAHELLNAPALLADPTPLIGRTHRQLFARALRRLHRANPLYSPLLCALGLAQGRGLPDQDGIWAQAADALAPDRHSTGGSIPGLLHDAAPYLALDQEHGQSVYRLAHRTFTEHFTTAPDTAQAHAALTTALIHLAFESPNTRDDTTPRPEDVSPYIRYHLAAHARLGHAAAALHALADHPGILDTLDLTSITTAALYSGLTPKQLPPAIAGTVLLQHHARGPVPDQQAGTVIGWRRWWRRLGTTYIQGTPPPLETRSRDSSEPPPALITGAVQRHQLHLQLTGHTGWVNTMAVFTAPDGTPRLATGSDDETVRIWNPTTGTQEGPALTGHTGWVHAVAVFTAPDGTPRLATGSSDETVRIWNPTTGTQDGPALTGHTGSVYAVAVFTALDGTPRLATGSTDGTIRIWNPAAGTQDGSALTCHARPVNAVAAFTALDGTPRLATGSRDGTLRIWDPAAGAQEGPDLANRTGWVNAVAVFTAPDGTPRLAVGSNDTAVRIWNPTTGTQDGPALTGHTGWVNAVAVFTALDGTPRLAVGSSDTAVRIWNPTTGTQDGPDLTGHTGPVNAVAAFTTPGGTPRLATGSNDTAVRILNPTTDTQGGPALTSPVSAVAAFTAPDGTPRLATGSNDGTLRIWNPTTGTQERPALTGHTGSVYAVGSFTAFDGIPRLATGSMDWTLRIWNPTTGTQEGLALIGHTGSVYAVAAFTAPDGTPRLATGSNDATVRIWNPTTGAREGPVLTGHAGSVNAVAAFTTPGGTPRLATGSTDGTLRIWNPTTGTQEGLALIGRTSSVNAVAVFTAPDGTPRLVIGSGDAAVRIWNPTTGAWEGPALTGHTGPVNAVAVFTAPDGSPRLATGSNDATVRIWDPQIWTGHALPLADRVYALATGHGLLTVGTSSGYLAIDISSLPRDLTNANPSNTHTPNPKAPTSKGASRKT
ncbi:MULTISPECIES: hypothetical protein [unclassified Streptomyces]|uniref:hypothetical protein n=1 Tax=unclassified Streptomyces TaxID=2593676 RepID=UPI0035DFAEBC